MFHIAGIHSSKCSDSPGKHLKYLQGVHHLLCWEARHLDVDFVPNYFSAKFYALINDGIYLDPHS